jgi:hypothetical protein
MKIPSNLILSKFNPVILDFCKDHKIQLDSDYDCLLSFLIYQLSITETTTNGLSLIILKEYLESLPEDFSTFPLNYNEYELELIRETFLSKRIEQQKEEIEQLHKNICDHFSQNSILSNCKIDKEKFKNFYLVLSSRSFGLDTEEGTFNALVPYGDMFNTSINPNERSCFWYFDDDKNFLVEAARDIPVNDEIFIRYGDGYNSEFLLYYGFTVDKNFNGKIENFEIKDNLGNIICEISIKSNPTIRDYNLENIKFNLANKFQGYDVNYDDLYVFELLKKNLNYAHKIFEKDRYFIYEKYKDKINQFNLINIKRIYEEEKIVIEKNLDFIQKVLDVLNLNSNLNESFLKDQKLSYFDIEYFHKKTENQKINNRI